MPTDAKVALLDRLSATGVQRIEAVSFVRPSAIPQMADADEVWKRAARAPSVRYSALVPNLRGALRALDAGFTELEAVVSASETHNRKNVNRSTGQSLNEIAEIISVAHERGATVQVIVSTAWGCPYEGDVPPARTVSVAGRAIADGADSASFGDTTGMATPIPGPRPGRGVPLGPPGDGAEPALPQHPGHRAGQRPGRPRARRVRL